MGPFVAWICARNGYDVALVDIKQEILIKAFDRIRNDVLHLFVEQGIIERNAAEAALTRISSTLSLNDAVKDADFVFEAVTQDLDLKKEVYKRLDDLSPKHTILATIQSGITVDELSSVTKRPDRVIAATFVSPLYFISLTEILPGKLTSQETVGATRELMTKLGRTVLLSKVPTTPMGHILRPLIYALASEAMDVVVKNVATPEEIDSALKNGLGLRFHIEGIFGLMDFSGLDVYLNSFKYMYSRTRDPRFLSPIEVLRKKVDKRELGVKARKGFYDYTGPGDIVAGYRAKYIAWLKERARENALKKTNRQNL